MDSHIPLTIDTHSSQRHKTHDISYHYHQQSLPHKDPPIQDMTTTTSTTTDGTNNMSKTKIEATKENSTTNCLADHVQCPTNVGSVPFDNQRRGSIQFYKISPSSPSSVGSTPPSAASSGSNTGRHYTDHDDIVEDSQLEEHYNKSVSGDQPHQEKPKLKLIHFKHTEASEMYDSARLLRAIAKAQLRAISNVADTTNLFDYLLKQALKLMNCSYGFLGELRVDVQSGSFHKSSPTTVSRCNCKYEDGQTHDEDCPLHRNNSYRPHHYPHRVDLTEPDIVDFSGRNDIIGPGAITQNLGAQSIGSSENDDHRPYLHMRVVANVPLSTEQEELFDEWKFMSFQHRAMGGIFQEVMEGYQVVIINDCAKHSEIFPKKHPHIINFIGLPLISEEGVIGMVGIANRKSEGGFKQCRDFEFLRPFITTCTTLLISHQNYLKRKETEFELQESYRTLERRVVERTEELSKEIDRRRETEKQLLFEKHRAEQAVVQKNVFLASLSHDLRTPLNSIISIADIMSRTGLTNEQFEYTHLIEVSGNMLINLVNDLLEFSALEMKQQSSTTVLEYKKFDLRKTMESILDIGTFSAQEKPDVEVVQLYDFDSFPSDITVVGDPFRLSTIFMNLLTNSSKFTLKGFISLKTRFLDFVECHNNEFKLGNRKIRVEFIVEDSGVGMPKEFLSRIGTPFTQNKNPLVSNVHGTGLGLVIAKTMIQLMEGELEIESELGAGSKFTVILQFEAIQGPDFDHDEFNEHVAIRKHSRLEQNRCNQCVILAESLENCMASLKQILLQLGFVDDNIFCTSNLTTIRALIASLRRKHCPFFLFIAPKILGIAKSNIAPHEKATQILELSPQESQHLILTTYLTFGKSIPSHLRVLKPFKLNNVEERVRDKQNLEPRGMRKNSQIEEEAQMNAPSGTIKNILIVDDNAINQKILSHILSQLGYKNHSVVDSGEKACELCRNQDFDVIFMDLLLGGIDGYEASKIITQEEFTRKGRVDSKIIALSAQSFEPSDTLKFEQHGMLPTALTKPISAKQISAFLQSC